MKRFALLGYPLGHTLSPFIHQKLFELEKIQGEYELFEVPLSNFKKSWDDLRHLNGFNVTIPYKVEILPFCRKLDESASRYGAVNTVDCRTFTGYNTDCTGFLAALQGEKPTGRVAVAGAGGVGRMFATEAARYDAQVFLAVREDELVSANKVCEDIKNKIPNAAASACTLNQLRRDNLGFDWFINATPVGMFPNTDESIMDAAFLSGCKNVFDAVYNPAPTKLLKLATGVGCNAIGGMAMLVWQAAQAHYCWYGAKHKKEDINKIIRLATAQLEK